PVGFADTPRGLREPPPNGVLAAEQQDGRRLVQNKPCEPREVAAKNVVSFVVEGIPRYARFLKTPRPQRLDEIFRVQIQPLVRPCWLQSWAFVLRRLRLREHLRVQLLEELH